MYIKKKALPIRDLASCWNSGRLQAKPFYFWANTSAQSSHLVQFLKDPRQQGNGATRHPSPGLTVPPDTNQKVKQKINDGMSLCIRA